MLVCIRDLSAQAQYFWEFGEISANYFESFRIWKSSQRKWDTSANFWRSLAVLYRLAGTRIWNVYLSSVSWQNRRTESKRSFIYRVVYDAEDRRPRAELALLAGFPLALFLFPRRASERRGDFRISREHRGNNKKVASWLWTLARVQISGGRRRLNRRQRIPGNFVEV